VWKGSFVKKDYDVYKHVSTKMIKYEIKKKLANSKNQEIMAKKRRR
jgi:hypothetical protein